MGRGGCDACVVQEPGQDAPGSEENLSVFLTSLCAICVTICRWTEVNPALHNTTLVFEIPEDMCTGLLREASCVAEMRVVPGLHSAD